MTTFDDDVDEFDFGADEVEDEKLLPGTKRGFEELLEDDEEEELYPAKKPAVSGEDHATTTILNLRASLDEKDAAISTLQAKLAASQVEVGKWRDAFRGASLLPPDTKPEPLLVLEAVTRLQAADVRAKEQVRAARGRETAMLLRLAAGEEERTELKNHMEEMREMMKPSTLQMTRLMLDPVIHAEFTHLKRLAWESDRRRRLAVDEAAAVAFTPHSRHGKMLMAKCRTLQDENDEMGIGTNEGKIHELENKVSLQKQLNSELNQAYSELKEYVDDMTQEEEKLQARIFSLQRQLRQREREVQDLHQLQVARESRRQVRGVERERERERETEMEREREREKEAEREREREGKVKREKGVEGSLAGEEVDVTTVTQGTVEEEGRGV